MKIRKIRSRTRILIALGDCAVTGNVPAMRNPFDTESVFERAYFENCRDSEAKADPSSAHASGPRSPGA